MEMMLHLLESIYSRRSGKYKLQFPNKLDKKTVVEFLEENGFEKVDYVAKEQVATLAILDEIEKMESRNTGKTGVYCTGTFDQYNKASKWIRFASKHVPGKILFFRTEESDWSEFVEEAYDSRRRITSRRIDKTEFYDLANNIVGLVEVSESVSSKRTGKYGSKGFPMNADLTRLEDYVGCLENSGFRWMPFDLNKMGFSILFKSFNSTGNYTEDGTLRLKDGSTIPLRFAFGDDRRVYRLYVLEYDKSTGRIRYDFDMQRSDGITMGYNDHRQWRDGAIKYFGLE